MAKLIPLPEIIEKANGPTVIARRIAALRGRRYTPNAVHMWEEVVPIDHVGVVSELSGIPRHLIRPDRPDLFPPPKKERAA